MSVLNKYNFPKHVEDRVLTKVAHTIQQLHESGHIKTASKAGNILLGGLAAGATAYSIPKVFSALESARIRAKKQSIIADMKRVHPDLNMYAARDIDIAFNSLLIHSPQVLEDPLVGGQMLRDMVQRGSADLNQLRTANQIGSDGLSNSDLEAIKHISMGVGGYVAYDPDKNAKPKRSKTSQSSVSTVTNNYYGGGRGGRGGRGGGGGGRRRIKRGGP